MAEKTHFQKPPRAAEIAKLESGQSIFMPQSAFKRISAKARKMLDSKQIEVSIQHARGRPIGLPMEKILQVIELHKDDRTYRQIEETTGIPKSTAHYLVKYAERQKLKSNGKIVYM